jgi:hypothetical protein
VTRLEALQLLLDEMQLVNLSEKDPDVDEAVEVLSDMVKEVESQSNEVDHALKVLHQNGCVPLVWGEASEVLKILGVKSTNPDTLETACREIAVQWDKSLPDELNAIVQQYLVTTYKNAAK